MFSVFSSSKGQAITSRQHVDADIPGEVEVIIRESADRHEVVNTLFRIAALIDAKTAAATESQRGRIVAESRTTHDVPVRSVQDKAAALKAAKGKHA